MIAPAGVLRPSSRPPQPAMMWAVRYSEIGAPDVLQVVSLSLPEPGPGEVRIRVAAAGVTYADTLQRRGMYPAPICLPQVPGGEIAGLVDAVGPGVSGVPRGARVAALIPGGGYAE